MKDNDIEGTKKIVKIFKDFGHIEKIKDYVDPDAEVTLLHIVANANKHEIMRVLLECNMNVNQKDVV